MVASMPTVPAMQVELLSWKLKVTALVRFWNNDVLSNTQGVLQVIAEALKV
jgi:very-short-patch-repair endonuclease